MRELHAAATRPRWEKLWAREEDSRSDISGGTSLSEPLQSLCQGFWTRWTLFHRPRGRLLKVRDCASELGGGIAGTAGERQWKMVEKRRL